jgi:hypothetical protein
MSSTLVKRVPVLSKITDLTLFIFSKMVFFFTSRLCFIARFNVMAITLGIANPNAHGQDATKTDIDLSNGTHHLQYSLI